MLTMELRSIQATRYVTPLREGGSLPAIVEADDDGMYVLKFRGAGQGVKSLIAELIAGELARSLGLPVPEIVFIELDPDLARTEPDPEIQDLIRASAGLNLALDYLPGSITFDPVAGKAEAELASDIVWFDAYVTNIDRTARNANMLVWHRKLWLIDHGAALYFQHTWTHYLDRSLDRFPAIKDHVLLRFATHLEAAHTKMTARLTPDIIRHIINLIPENWLVEGSPFTEPDQHREAYIEYLLKRLESSQVFLEEAIRAQSLYL
ncbi:MULTISPECIES: HipA family kinase [Leptolyngbya]|uniref:HipA family kinase n=1 Tax=Leptolyngbya TaxID=47251 RepID=UPI001687342A|nr:HipA family kinase [Leptolyngbya sp. FACHB-1624]MBD1856353.1 aminotransferase class I and II [Leptolyngbya sp. FACHB-1624]